MIIPTIIEIKSDGNKLEFVSEKKGIYTYKYIFSKSKKGQLLEMDEQQLIKLVNINS